MRQGQQNRRGRGRGRKSQNPLARNYESNGPDVKIRGTASHIAEKYMTLARDALSSGDSVGAESYLQHAEHYNRIIMAAQNAQPPQGNQPNDGANGNNYRGKSDDDEYSDDNRGSDNRDSDNRGSDNKGSDNEERAASSRSDKPRRNSKRNDDGSRRNGADKSAAGNASHDDGDGHDDQPSAGAKPREEGASEEAVN